MSHYSPKFANKAWSDENNFLSYFYCPHRQKVKKIQKGRKQWGRKRGLYTWQVECALDRDLENDAGQIYEKICTYNEVAPGERVIWAQFLLSQLVRTPTFIKYETEVKKIFGITEKPMHDRVGCRECGDLNFVANRDWCLLLAHENDFFLRSDNPVFQSGFIERAETCLFYPLKPNLCFVACSMPANWNAYTHFPNETCGYQLAKGGAHFINFHLAKAAGESLIISPKHDGEIAEGMYGDMLGTYPQPPFSLHTIVDEHLEVEKAYESIRILMSKTDGFEYPTWQPMELEPFYQKIKGAIDTRQSKTHLFD